MKFSITHNNLLRTIDGNFTIAGTRADLQHLARCIDGQVGGPDFCQNSVKVLEVPERNIEVKDWAE